MQGPAGAEQHCICRCSSPCRLRGVGRCHRNICTLTSAVEQPSLQPRPLPQLPSPTAGKRRPARAKLLRFDTAASCDHASSAGSHIRSAAPVAAAACRRPHAVAPCASPHPAAAPQQPWRPGPQPRCSRSCGMPPAGAASWRLTTPPRWRCCPSMRSLAGGSTRRAAAPTREWAAATSCGRRWGARLQVALCQYSCPAVHASWH